MKEWTDYFYQPFITHSAQLPALSLKLNVFSRQNCLLEHFYQLTSAIGHSLMQPGRLASSSGKDNSNWLFWQSILLTLTNQFTFTHYKSFWNLANTPKFPTSHLQNDSCSSNNYTKYLLTVMILLVKNKPHHWRLFISLAWFDLRICWCWNFFLVVDIYLARWHLHLGE